MRRTPDDPEHDLPLTMLRMDFAARVQTRDGSERQVPIEIQKPAPGDRALALPPQIERGQHPHPPSGRTEAVPIVTILPGTLDDLSA